MKIFFHKQIQFLEKKFIFYLGSLSWVFIFEKYELKTFLVEAGGLSLMFVLILSLALVNIVFLLIQQQVYYCWHFGFQLIQMCSFLK